MKKDKRWIFIAILFIGIIGIMIYGKIEDDKIQEIEKEKTIQRKKEDDKMEIQAYVYEMFLYALSKKKSNPNTTCVSIFPIENNYIGSVDVSTDNYYIWLSDGTFYVYGTEDNLELIESQENATIECKY